MKFTYKNPNTEYSYHTNDKGGTEYRRTQDGHGGHGAEHRAEMEQIATRIAEQKIAEKLPEIQRTAYIYAYNNLIAALEFDVTSAVSIGLENCGEIFYDSKTQRILAEAITREIRKQLNTSR